MAANRSSWMDDDLDALRDLARTFCEKEIAPHSARFIEQHHVDRDLWTRAGDLGLLCMSIPEQYGGMELDILSLMLIGEQVARLASFSVSFGAHSGIGTAPVLYFANQGPSCVFHF